MDNLFKQIEAYTQMLKLLDIKYPLNFTRGWAASPDFLLLSFKKILQIFKGREKILILEAGSGVSSVFLGYFLKKYFPQGKLISLEHEYDFYLKTKEELNLHGLGDVNLVYAPLVKFKIGDKEWLWYDYEKADLEKGTIIDVLFVDGPPQVIQETARYPILPLMKKYLSSKFLLFLDDANRKDEKETARMWLSEVSPCSYEFWDTEKGSFFLKKNEIRVNDLPFFSICIPTYNRSVFLKEAIRSVLSQSHKNFEVIVYDDGSTQDIFSVVNSFNDKRIKFFKGEKNRGRPFARNECIKRAKGDWIVWLDDDDILLPDALSGYVENILRFTDVSVFYYRNLAFLGSNLSREQNKSMKGLNFTDFYKNGKHLKYFLSQGSVIPNPGVCLKKSLYDRFGFYDERFLRAQDYEFWTRVLPFIEVKGISGIGTFYRIHEGNVSANLDTKDSSFESLIVRKYLDIVPVDEIFYFVREHSEKLKLIGDTLLRFEDFLNAAFYYWCGGFHEGAKMVLKKGFVIEDLKKEKKFLDFIEKRRFRAALKFAQRYLPFLYKYIAKFYLSTETHDEKKATAFLKRAVLVCPSVDFLKFDIPEHSNMEVDDVLQRVICNANTLENDLKAKFFSKFLAKYTDITKFYSVSEE